MIFGWVSLLQDLGSKMVAPVVPLLLAGPLGASPLVIAFVDGAGEVMASTMKSVGGRLADGRRPLPMVRLGYATSSVAKAAIAAATLWPAVLGLRLLDRAGKGLRDAPRDVMLAGAAGERAGRAFGVQQAMDKLGGFLGPLLGIAVYQAFDERLRPIFLVALVPCLASVVVLVIFLDGNDEPRTVPPTEIRTATVARRRTRRRLRPDARRAIWLLGGHGAVALPAGLLLLRAVDVGLDPAGVLLAYSGNRAVIAATSLPAGNLADRIGARRTVAYGMAAHAVALVLFGLAAGPVAIAAALAVTGLGDALVRGPSKAFVAGLVDAGDRGLALGSHGFTTGMASLVGALVAGAAWNRAGAAVFFVAAGCCAAVAAAQATASR